MKAVLFVRLLLYAPHINNYCTFYKRCKGG